MKTLQELEAENLELRAVNSELRAILLTREGEFFVMSGQILEKNKEIIEKDEEIKKLNKEAQFLRSNDARYKLEKAIIEDLLNGEELSGRDSDYETELTDKVEKKIKELKIANKTANLLIAEAADEATKLDQKVKDTQFNLTMDRGIRDESLRINNGKLICEVNDLKQQILNKEKIIKQSCLDWADDDTKIKEICAKFGIDESHVQPNLGFKSMVECVEELAEKYKNLLDKNNKNL